MPSQHRQLCDSSTMRQLNFDSSPKGGLEVLGIREFVIRGQEIDKAQDRRLPIQALGFGLMSAVDKATALLHSIYLESGPTSHSMRNYCASVNILLTDAGVEQYVPQLPDCIDEFLSHELHDLDFKGCSSLWPNAMRVLDWGHLWHWLSQTVLQSLSFFSEWEKLAKAVCKLCRTTSYNDALVTTLKEDNVAEVQEEIAGLRNFHASFAKWRFGTVKAVLKSLRQCEKGLKKAWQRLPKKSRDTDLNHKVQMAIDHPAFWTWNRVLSLLVDFAEENRMWGLGCRCHERECQEAARRHQQFECKKKSMRGPELSHHLAQCKVILLENVEAFLANEDVQDATIRTELQQSASLFLALLDLKLGFVQQMPWLVWQMRASRAAAPESIA